MWSYCCDRDPEDEGDGNGGGSTEVSSGGVEGEIRPEGGNCVRVEGETSAYER